MNGIHEVTGSIPVWSTILRSTIWFQLALFWSTNTLKSCRE